MMKRITVITGHYGSGKSTFAANYAIQNAAAGERVTVVDMDTVNPYYRTADLESVFSENGVRLTAPMYAGTNLDVPILDYDIPALFEEGSNLVIDMGGDDAGAYPLGKFADFLRLHADETQLLYVVNFRRYLTHDARGAADILSDIERACGIPAAAIINNTNLGEETDALVIEDGIKKAAELSREISLPVMYTTVPEFAGDIGCPTDVGLFPLKIYIKNVWG